MRNWQAIFAAAVFYAITASSALAQGGSQAPPPTGGAGVPGPIAGAGLPFVAAGVCYLVRRWRKR